MIKLMTHARYKITAGCAVLGLESQVQYFAYDAWLYYKKELIFDSKHLPSVSSQLELFLLLLHFKNAE